VSILKNTHPTKIFCFQVTSGDEEEVEVEQPLAIPSMTRVMELNAKEWPYIVVGIIFSAIAGMMPVAFAVILAEILQVRLIMRFSFEKRFSWEIVSISNNDGWKRGRKFFRKSVKINHSENIFCQLFPQSVYYHSPHILFSGLPVCISFFSLYSRSPQPIKYN